MPRIQGGRHFRKAIETGSFLVERVLDHSDDGHKNAASDSAARNASDNAADIRSPASRRARDSQQIQELPAKSAPQNFRGRSS